MKYIHCQPCRPKPLICSSRPGQRAGDQRRDGRTAEEDRNGLAALDARQPAGEVVDHPGEEPGFGHAQQEAQDIEVGFVLDERHAGGHDAPGQHDAGQPDARADFLQENVGGHFEQRVTDEEQAGTEAIGGSADAQVMFHVGADEADVHTVDVVDDEHDHEQRQYVPFHFRDGGLQDRIGAVVHPGYGCIHLVISH